MLPKWAVQTESSPLRPVLPLSQLSHTSCLMLVLVLVLQMQAGSGEKRAKMPARPTRRQSAAAVAAALINTDELGEFERRIDIVASLLVLNHEARSFDDAVPKLMPRTAALYGGFGAMEKESKAYKKVMKNVDYAKQKLLVGLESVCWEPNGAAAAADSAAADSDVVFEHFIHGHEHLVVLTTTMPLNSPAQHQSLVLVCACNRLNLVAMIRARSCVGARPSVDFWTILGVGGWYLIGYLSADAAAPGASTSCL